MLILGGIFACGNCILGLLNRQYYVLSELKQMLNNLVQHLQYRKKQFTRLLERLRSYFYVWLNVKHIHGKRLTWWSKSDCTVLSVVRDCEDYIESFIQHYLALGVKHIVLMDNGSKDGTISRAAKYKQVTIVECHLSFAEYKRDMRQFLIDHYSFNRWCLLVDCDEFFDYPCSDEISFRDLLAWLDIHRYNAVMGQMLDMFPRGAIQTQSNGKNLDFLQSHRWFEIADIEEKLLPSGLSNKMKDKANLKLHYGGVRNRVFNNSPFLSKFALLKPNFRLQLVGSHLVQWANIADITCVMFHYKFLPQFTQVVDKAVREKQYYNNSSEYKRYQEVLLENNTLILHSHNSIEYRNINQLLELGFIKVNKNYIQYKQEINQGQENTRN